MGLLGCGQEKGMQSAQRGRGQGLAAAQPTMELFIPLHFTILLCLCLLLLGPCSWLALHVLLLVPISSTIFVILILPVTSLVLLSVAYLELPQPGCCCRQRQAGRAGAKGRWRRRTEHPAEPLTPLGPGNLRLREPPVPRASRWVLCSEELLEGARCAGKPSLLG
ncbi:uncharacterized protein [Anser cygnoides]|uniref:uncharacterized protein isoform X5 n=1 Tax=Anser cygnoides TaxID=8845 RepID=UPI0034D1D0F7